MALAKSELHRHIRHGSQQLRALRIERDGGSFTAYSVARAQFDAIMKLSAPYVDDLRGRALSATDIRVLKAFDNARNAAESVLAQYKTTIGGNSHD